MAQEIGATEGGRDWGAIVAPCLDDYGLTPYEMRVYIRLARRAGMGGQCWESVSKMARACQMSDRKVKDCLALLTAAHLIKQIKRPAGMTNLYELMPEAHWLPAEQLEALRNTVTAYRTSTKAKRQRTKQRELEDESRCHVPGYEIPGYSEPRYNLPIPQVPNTYPPGYEIPIPQVPCTYKEDPLRIPNKNSQEEDPLSPLTPFMKQTHESASERDVCKEELRQVAKEGGIYTSSASLTDQLELVDKGRDLDGDECSAPRQKTQTAEIANHTPIPLSNPSAADVVNTASCLPNPSG